MLLSGPLALSRHASICSFAWAQRPSATICQLPRASRSYNRGNFRHSWIQPDGARGCGRRAHCQATAEHGSKAPSAPPDKPFVITTPLYYVNAAPHMGSAYSTLAADVISRYQRLAQREVIFITGTDEHGEKIAAAAAAQGVQPQQHCDGIAQQYQALWQKMDISQHRFVRTTSSAHKALVSRVLQKAHDKGDIYKAAYSGHYCVGCEKYMDEDEMVEDHMCPTHRTECKLREEENYFFRLSRYQKQLCEYLEANKAFVAPDKRLNEVLGWINSEGGVRDFSLSRSKVEWGIPVPWDKAQTIYVWTEALHGYLTGTVQGGPEEPGLDDITAAGWPANIHVVGKDILRFHAVMWPALLMSAGLPLPLRVVAHGFLTKDGLKMGKSLGNTLDPVALVEAYGADALRWFFMREVVFGEDGDFSEARFRDLVNASLANNVGNLLNRTLNLLHKFCGGLYPGNSSDVGQDAALRAEAAQQVPKAWQAYEALDFGAAGATIQAISGRANQYLEQQAPWTSLKKGTEEQKAGGRQVLADCLEAVRIVAVLLAPITPSLSARIYAQLGFDEASHRDLCLDHAQWGGLKEGHQTSKPAPVFTRLEGDSATSAPGAAR